MRSIRSVTHQPGQAPIIFSGHSVERQCVAVGMLASMGQLSDATGRGEGGADEGGQGRLLAQLTSFERMTAGLDRPRSRCLSE